MSDRVFRLAALVADWIVDGPESTLNRAIVRLVGGPPTVATLAAKPPEVLDQVEALIAVAAETWAARHDLALDDTLRVHAEMVRLRSRQTAQRIIDEEDAEATDDTSWGEVDLTAALSGDKAAPRPTILRREDGKHLFYEGQVNYLHGPDGVGKSLAGLFAAIEVIRAGDHVVWLDWEDPDETTIIARLTSLGVDAATIAECFHYVHPETETTPAAIAQVVDLVERYSARLVVIDSVGEAFGVDGINEDRDNEVTPWFRRVVRPLVAAGPAVLPIDHGVKSGDNPLFPSGSKRKRAMVTGAGFYVEAPRPISQEFNGGRLRLTTAKDRHGNFTRGKPAAEIEVNFYPDGGWTFHVWPPTDDAQRHDLTIARAAVRAVKTLRNDDGITTPSMTLVESAMKVKGAHAVKRAGIELSVAKGALRETDGPRGARCFEFVRDLEA